MVHPVSRTRLTEQNALGGRCGLHDLSRRSVFVEDNWSLGRLGDQSFDARAGLTADLFDFRKPANKALLLDPATGELSSSR